MSFDLKKDIMNEVFKQQVRQMINNMSIQTNANCYYCNRKRIKKNGYNQKQRNGDF